MTTVVGWVGADSRGPSSVYLAADSRISVGQAKWDSGRKVFAASNAPVVLAFSGEAAYGPQVLAKCIDQITVGVIDSQGAEFAQELSGAILDGLPKAPLRHPFDVVVVRRVGQGMACRFDAVELRYGAAGAPRVVEVPIPTISSVFVVRGSGGTQFRTDAARWASSDAAGTSRAIFSAFCDAG